MYFRLAFLQLFRDKRVVHDFLAMLIPFVGMYLIFSLMPLLQTDDLDEEMFRLLGPSAQGARVLFFCMVAFIGLIAFVFLTMRLRKNLSYYLLLNVLGFSAFRIAVLHLVELVLLLGLTIPMGTVIAALLGLLLRGSLAHFMHLTLPALGIMESAGNVLKITLFFLAAILLLSGILCATIKGKKRAVFTGIE